VAFSGGHGVEDLGRLGVEVDLDGPGPALRVGKAQRGTWSETVLAESSRRFEPE
jgi:hypothetical protein